MYRNYGRRGWNNYKKKKPRSPLAEFKNHTELTRKHFLSDYLLTWLNDPTPPYQAYLTTETGSKVTCYVLCKLPYDCLAVFAGDKVYIVEGVNPDGSLRLMPGVYYSSDSRDRMWADRLGYSIWESDFVNMVREIVMKSSPRH